MPDLLCFFITDGIQGDLGRMVVHLQTWFRKYDVMKACPKKFTWWYVEGLVIRIMRGRVAVRQEIYVVECRGIGDPIHEQGLARQAPTRKLRCSK